MGFAEFRVKEQFIIKALYFEFERTLWDGNDYTWVYKFHSIILLLVIRTLSSLRTKSQFLIYCRSQRQCQMDTRLQFMDPPKKACSFPHSLISAIESLNTPFPLSLPDSSRITRMGLSNQTHTNQSFTKNFKETSSQEAKKQAGACLGCQLHVPRPFLKVLGHFWPSKCMQSLSNVCWRNHSCARGPF